MSIFFFIILLNIEKCGIMQLNLARRKVLTKIFIIFIKIKKKHVRDYSRKAVIVVKKTELFFFITTKKLYR